MAHWVLLAACATDPAGVVKPGGDEAPDVGDTAAGPDTATDGDPADPTLTWGNTGHPIMLTYCTGCHSSLLSGAQRYGAPEDVNLDTLEGVTAHLDRVRARTVESGDMPPTGGVPEATRARLGAWLDLGAPGDPDTLPTIPTSSRTYLSASTDTWAGLRDGWLVLTREAYPEGEIGGLYTEEEYVVDGDQVWFGGYTILELAGDRWRGVRFDPPIALPVLDERFDEEITVMATIDEDGVVTTAEQRWTLSAGPPSQLDGRDADRNPTAFVMTEDGGEQHGWHLSDTVRLSTRWIQTSGGVLHTFQQRVHYASDVPTPLPLPFPFQQGDAWVDAVIVEGEDGLW